jgi:hypothetical protein
MNKENASYIFNILVHIVFIIMVSIVLNFFVNMFIQTNIYKDQFKSIIENIFNKVLVNKDDLDIVYKNFKKNYDLELLTSYKKQIDEYNKHKIIALSIITSVVVIILISLIIYLYNKYDLSNQLNLYIYKHLFGIIAIIITQFIFIFTIEVNYAYTDPYDLNLKILNTIYKIN